MPNQQRIDEKRRAKEKRHKLANNAEVVLCNESESPREKVEKRKNMKEKRRAKEERRKAAKKAKAVAKKANAISASDAPSEKVLSTKARNVPLQTHGRLHEVTKAAPRGLGTRNAAQLIGRAKRMRQDIWEDEGDLETPAGVAKKAKLDHGNRKNSGSAPSDPVASSSIFLNPHWQQLLDIELRRNYAVEKSRKKLYMLCKEVGAIPPVMAWERWQAGKKLIEGPEPCGDPLLPSKSSSSSSSASRGDQKDCSCPADEALIRDLLRVLPSMEPKAASCSNSIKDTTDHDKSRAVVAKICDQLCEHSRELVTALGKPNKISEAAATVLKVQHHRHTSDFIYQGKLLKLNHAHYEKLRTLFQRHGDKHCEQEEAVAIFRLLLRYHTLSGHGMQCALPEQVFHVLKKYLNTSIEAFASPLNCRFGNNKFCSAFADSDACFGSLGSFFDVFRARHKKKGRLYCPFLDNFPRGGSFELNPPFIEVLMAQMVDVVEGLLLKDGMPPLLFSIILPGWRESRAWQRLSTLQKKFGCEVAEGIQKQSKRTTLRLPILIAAADHGYVSGAQHQRRDRYLAAPFDTGVFIVGNVAGWKTLADMDSIFSERDESEGALEQDLRAAFASAIPTEAEAQRRLRDARGFGDLDGGGGRYRGKKAKRKKRNDKQSATGATGA